MNDFSAILRSSSADTRRRNPGLFGGQQEAAPALPAGTVVRDHEPKRAKMNKTEQRCGTEIVDKLPGLVFKWPQTPTILLPTGERYRPDWMVGQVLNGKLIITIIEVKGGHKFYSHGRSILAFHSTALHLPLFSYILATWDKGKWTLEYYRPPQPGNYPSQTEE